jgi:lipopolysaccharide heptosyltransferase II
MQDNIVWTNFINIFSKKMKKTSENKKLRILIIRLSAMGDIILTTALIRLVRKKFPNATIDFLCAKQFSEIFAHNPHLNSVLKYDKSKRAGEIVAWRNEHIKENGKFDILIDLHNNLRSTIFRGGIAENYYVFKKNRFRKLSLVFFKKAVGLVRQIPDIYLDTVKDLEVVDDGLGLELWLESDGDNYPHKVKKNKEAKKIALAPGARHFTKRWPPDKFIDLIDLLKAKYPLAEIVLIGGKSDKAITDQILAESQHTVTDCTSSVSILKTAEVIDSCDLLIVNDTGVMHMAAARQVPIIAIFGSTTADFGFAPYRAEHKIIEQKLACRPCTHVGRRFCPKKHFKCMLDIAPERVLEEM